MEQKNHRLIVIVALIVGLIAGGRFVYANSDYIPVEVRYKVTVNVDDNGTMRSGSSVWSFTLAKSVAPLASPFNPKFRGEAVAVDIPERGTLFALVKGSDIQMYPESLFGEKADRASWMSERVENLRAIKKLVGQSVTLDCTSKELQIVRCPEMVRFRDINDPKSVELVEPDKLDVAFGKGVSLSDVSVEITGDFVTNGIEKILPSYGPETGFDTWFRSLPLGDPRQISKYDFIYGVVQ